jgi:hypothetical protein
VTADGGLPQSAAKEEAGMPGTDGLLARHAELTVAEALADTRVVAIATD